ncbi:MAG: immunoglobulin domain-containing protein [Chitinophagaceae bacterium]
MPSSLLLLKTDEVSDATINKSNATIVTPVLLTGTNYVGFRGTFTGFNPSSRFMLVDDTLCNPADITITPSSDTNLCPGAEVTLNASRGTGYTYQWYKDGVAIPGATASAYTASTAGNYTVQVKVSGCPAKTPAVTITVKPALSVYNVSGGGKLCVGDAGFDISLSGSDTGVTYQLYNGGGPTGTPLDGTGNALHFGLFSTSGNYTVIASSKTTSCSMYMSGNAAIDAVARPIALLSPAGTVAIKENESTTLTAAKGTDYTYQWLRNEAVMSGQTDTMLLVTEEGAYKLVVSNGICSDTSDVTDVRINTNADLKLTLLPNPNDGAFTVKGMLDKSYDGKVSMILVNMLGQKIYTYETYAVKGYVEANFALSQLLAKARYLVKISAGEEEHVLPLLIGK